MAPSTWICSKCTFKDDGSKPGPCVICQAPHPKCRAVASVPTPDEAPLDNLLNPHDRDSNGNNNEDKDEDIPDSDDEDKEDINDDDDNDNLQQ